MLTRSQAQQSRHPQAEQAFKEGLQSIFRQWTALELAVQNGWGGLEGHDKPQILLEEILAMFLGPEKIYKDDISLVLDDFMETHFSTICEDGSTDELGEMFVTMWRQCCEGDFTLVTNALSREFQRHEVLSQCQGISNTGDVMENDEDDVSLANNVDVMQSIIEEESMDVGQITDRTENQEEKMTSQQVGSDGWEMVSRGKSKSKNKKK